MPPPYQGQSNPFPWADAAAQSAGKAIFLKLCQGCHGAAGGLQSTANFPSAEFHLRLGTEPDYFFWRVSEGKPVARGFSMPSFKTLLSEVERWQVLTFLYSLGTPSR